MRRSWIERILSMFFGLAPVWAVLGALLIGAVFIALAGISPVNAYAALMKGAFGSLSGFGITMQKTIPLIFAGLGVAFAFRCGLFNIGGEGQLYIGALFGGVVALTFTGLPAPIMLPAVLIASFIGGGIWGAIPGLLRAKWKMSEIITTILMNYVGFWFVSFLLHGPLQESRGYYPQSEILPQASWLPMIWPAARVHLGIILALLAAAAVYVVMWRTTIGYQIRAVGSNPQAAEYSGIPVVRSMVLAMFVSGGLMGLAGAAEILGVQHRLSDFFSPGYGFDGIAVALLGYTHPVGVVLAAVFFGGLRAGFNAIQRTQGLPLALAQVVQGLTLILVVASVFLPRLRAMLKRKEAVGAGRAD
jgi:simple sugar transport system permease protein